MKGLPKNLPDFKDSFHICLLTKATKSPIFPTIDVSIFSSGFMLYIHFSFYNFESIRGFTLTCVAICSAAS